MDFGVCLAGMFCMPPRVEPMAVRDVGMMCRLVVRTRFVVLGRFMMVMCRLGVVFCGSVMMFDSLFDFGHQDLP
jgi:hypothetical protein